MRIDKQDQHRRNLIVPPMIGGGGMLGVQLVLELHPYAEVEAEIAALGGGAA